MTVSVSERGLGQEKEAQPALNGTLQQIAIDVAQGIQATPNRPAGNFYLNFTQSLKEGIKKTRDNLSPGGTCYEVMKVIKGDEFTTQPLEIKYDMAAQINALSEDQKNIMAHQGLIRLYEAYKTADPKDISESQKTWEGFVKAHQLFHAYAIGERLYFGFIPYHWLDETQYHNLPSLPGSHFTYESPSSFNPKAAQMNTEFQMHMARASGILGPNETWFDFIHRDTIKVVDRSYRRSECDKGLIIGEKWGESFSLGGMPAYYYDVPTKYPEVKALIGFDYHYDQTGKYNRKLDDLMAEGVLSPRVMLGIPTKAFLPSESK